MATNDISLNRMVRNKTIPIAILIKTIRLKKEYQQKQLMKSSLFYSIYAMLLVVSVMGLFSSCHKDDDDLPSLTGTVWIHQFTPEDHIVDGSAAALYFGKEKVEYYALDANLKVLRQINSLDYQIKEQTIVIGIKEGTLSDNTLYFDGVIYYRTSKSIADLLLID